jgi:hypothetical protein
MFHAALLAQGLYPAHKLVALTAPVSDKNVRLASEIGGA